MPFGNRPTVPKRRATTFAILSDCIRSWISSIRLRAAACVFDYALKGIEVEDIEERLAELERSADQTKPGWRK
jgi:hypothetical protein